jgi:crotonobetaine/carnitine-CoA ligase
VRIIYCPPYPPGGDEFQRRFRVKLVWQGFGMTEIYTHPYFDHPPAGVSTDTVGHPVAWMDYGVVDTHDLMLPTGETGELVFRPLLTDAMARGYYREPEATVEAFRNFMFHTGDLAYLDEAGQVHFVGRKQDRIRRRGENVSAAELENIALGHPAVVEAAAYGVAGEFGEHDVKLDVVCAGQAPSPTDLHGWLAERLPRYMVPRYLEYRDEFPKTPSERVEKYRLRDEGTDRDAVWEFAPPERPH